jgi:GNAT superfamily N-acetyltransferase
MSIRSALLSDGPAIEQLLDQLGYTGTDRFLPQKLRQMLADSDERLLVYETTAAVVAFISVHFIPQIAVAGDFARISYFSVADSVRGQGIGREMEEYAVMLAKERGCDRIEVHCHSRRVDAHRFYSRQGYEESPKYLMKRLAALPDGDQG